MAYNGFARKGLTVGARLDNRHQVLSNQESLRLQYALRQCARDLGWQEADIEVVDADLGLSGVAVDHRRGFKDLIARVTLGEIGIILSYDVTRLARNCSDWYPLLDLCGYYDCLIADRDGVYNAGTANGRLLLGLKVKDATAGYRLFRRTTLEAIDLGSVRSTGYVFQTDLAYRTVTRGLRLAEVPIEFIERERGDSKMSGQVAGESLKLITRWGLSERRAQVRRARGRA